MSKSEHSRAMAAACAELVSEAGEFGSDECVCGWMRQYHDDPDCECKLFRLDDGRAN